jgi:hypothetical protein
MNIYNLIASDLNDSLAVISNVTQDDLNGSMSLSGDEDFMSWPNQYNEERIESSSNDASIRPTDVLCGRGKVSFNHGKWVK